VAKPSAGTARSNGFVLALLCTTAVIELATVAVAAAWVDEVAEASPFGRQGTTLVASVLAVLVIVTAVVAWSGAAGAFRVVAGILAAASAGIAAMLALFFLFEGSTIVSRSCSRMPCSRPC